MSKLDINRRADSLNSLATPHSPPRRFLHLEPFRIGQDTRTRFLGCLTLANSAVFSGAAMTGLSLAHPPRHGHAAMHRVPPRLVQHGARGLWRPQRRIRRDARIQGHHHPHRGSPHKHQGSAGLARGIAGGRLRLGARWRGHVRGGRQATGQVQLPAAWLQEVRMGVRGQRGVRHGLGSFQSGAEWRIARHTKKRRCINNDATLPLYSCGRVAQVAQGTGLNGTLRVYSDKRGFLRHLRHSRHAAWPQPPLFQGGASFFGQQKFRHYPPLFS